MDIVPWECRWMWPESAIIQRKPSLHKLTQTYQEPTEGVIHTNRFKAMVYADEPLHERTFGERVGENELKSENM